MYRIFGKRALDISLSLVAALPALIIVSVCILIIRLRDPGPAIFRQVRIGRNEFPFTLYKLRTMSLGTGDRASHEVSEAQVTSIGRVLRRTKLDELPQLINVLRGEMSFVGPRPCLPSQTLLLEERRRRGVHAVRPGITGPAQLAGINMSTPAVLAETDATYLARMSFAYDLGCIVRTGLGKGAGDAVKIP
jgi:O-antigen biosynthesis protein WbqP